MRYEAGDADPPRRAVSFTGASGDLTDRSQLIDGGRYMNRLSIPTVGYDGGDSRTGAIQLSSAPRHVVLTHTLAGAEIARVVLEGGLVDALPNARWSVPGRVLVRTDARGEGWLFAVYDTDGVDVTLEVGSAGEIVATGASVDGGAATISLLMAPLSALGPGEEALYTDPRSAVEVTTTLLDRYGAEAAAPAVAAWDPTLGAYRADLGTLQDAGAPSRADFDDPEYHHWHGLHRVTIAPADGTPTAVPVALFGSDDLSWYITGGVAMLRDPEGAPTGLGVQISKNWHSDDWYHLYAQPVVSAGTTTLELTMASSKWGDVYAASHAQLSLIGWSTAGAFGESITYDPDLALRRARMDDVRPLLVDANGRWNWTGNVGGAEFLRYIHADTPYWTRRVARVRSMYDAPGPNLTDVTYAGVTSDGRIRVEARPQLVASDELVRTFLSISFTFLEDVEYERLALFQVAADTYAHNGVTRYAWGNAAGVVEDRAFVATGYVEPSDRGIPLEGEAPWVFLYASALTSGSLPEHLANVGFVVRSFEADIGGVPLTTPHMSVYHTLNGGWPQASFELSLPYEERSPWCGAPCGDSTAFVPAARSTSRSSTSSRRRRPPPGTGTPVGSPPSTPPSGARPP